MNVLFIGDIFGNTGIRAVTEILPYLKQKHNLDLIIANAENATNGDGLSKSDYKKLIEAGVNIITLGNHAFGQSSILDIINNQDIIRPLNFESNYKYSNYGYGSRLFEFNNKIIRVTNLLGESIGHRSKIQVNPFIEMNNLINNKKIKEDIHIVDFHAEFTGEKNAFLVEFAGKVSAIIGTHTHVQTADNRISKGTAFITDVGMTGPHDGIIGADPEIILERAKGINNKNHFQEAKGHFQFNAVFISFGDNNKATQIKNIFIVEENECMCD